MFVYVLFFKTSNGAIFDVAMGQDIIFDVPALGNKYYCDFSTSYFRVKVDVTLTNRVPIQDASGTLLEIFENYNDL